MVTIRNLLVLSLLQVQSVLAFGSVCQHFPYAELLPLKNYPPAESYCSHHYPLPPVTVTRTVTIPTITIVTVSKTYHTAKVTTSVFTSTIYTSTTTSYVYTATVTATATTGTSTQTIYTSTETDTVYTQTNLVTEYTSTSTDYQTTGTDTITATVATLPTTITTGTVTAFTTTFATVTISSGTTTIHTTIDTGLKKRKPHDPRDALLPKLAACEKSSLKTACSCIEFHPPTHTVTATVRRTHTSFKTIGITKTIDVIGKTTTKKASTSTISTASTTTTSVLYVTTLLLVETDTVRIDSISTVSTVLVTEVPTAAITTTSVTSFSTVDVAVTKTLPTVGTTTVIVPIATATASVDVPYSLVFGPTDGCTYNAISDINGLTAPYVPADTSHTERVAICAAFCDQTPGCVLFSMNWFPGCPGVDSPFVSCIASSAAWAGIGTMLCGITDGSTVCPFYLDGTVYQRS